MLFEYLEESSNYVYTKHLLLIINLHELQAYKFVKFSDLAKNWYFCTPIIIIFSVAPPFEIWKNILKCSKHL